MNVLNIVPFLTVLTVALSSIPMSILSPFSFILSNFTSWLIAPNLSECLVELNSLNRLFSWVFNAPSCKSESIVGLIATGI